MCVIDEVPLVLIDKQKRQKKPSSSIATDITAHEIAVPDLPKSSPRRVSMVEALQVSKFKQPLEVETSVNIISEGTTVNVIKVET